MSLDAASSFSGEGSSEGAADAAPVRRCAACGYDLRGLEQLRCPECGLEFDPNFLPPADIPWLKRGQALDEGESSAGGALVAYWQTVWLALAQPRKLGEMVWQDVDVDAAETARFRWVTIGIAVGSMLATMLTLTAAAAPKGLVVLLALAAPLAAFFWMATGRFDIIQFTAPWFAQEMRYRRLHDLSCAGLALAPVVPMFLLLGLAMGWPWEDAAAGATALMWLVIFAWWYGSLRYQIHGGRCRPGDAVLHALLLPFAWFMIAVVILIFALGIMGLVAGLLGS